MPTPEENERLYRDLIRMVNAYVAESEGPAGDFLIKFETWLELRNDVIPKIEKAVELIKDLNNKTDPLQTLCKIGSAGGKVATFCGPAPAAVGACTSVVLDTTYTIYSSAKVKQLEIIYDKVLTAIDADRDATAELFDEMQKIKRTSGKLKTCIKKFHAGTIQGLFDNVPSLQSFINAVKRIDNVENLKGLKDFLSVLQEEGEMLLGEPNLFDSVVSLLTYNPDVMNITLTIPGILVNYGIFAVGEMPGGLAGRFASGFNVFGIIVDVCEVVSKIRNYNSNTKMAEELLKIKEQLEKEKEKILEMKEKMSRSDE